MRRYIYDLKKEAHLLTGTERARVIIKDDYKRTYGDKKGFLSEEERQAVLYMPDYQTKEKYQSLWKIYERMPLIMADINEAYLSFKYYFEALKKAHLLLIMSPSIGHLSRLIAENIADEAVRKDALETVDAIQVLRTDPFGNPGFKETLSFIKGIIPKAYEHACRFVSMKEEVDRINEIIGFNIFINEHLSDDCKVFAEEIALCIEEHNQIMKRFGEGAPDLESYLITELTPKD